MSKPLLSRDEIARLTLADETGLVRALLPRARLNDALKPKIRDTAMRLVRAARAGRRQYGGIDAFMTEYGLSSEEGVVLMCLAEALLRIPDADTADRLIADKIGGRSWDKHLGKSDSVFVNASTWALMLTGRIVDPKQAAGPDLSGFTRRLAARTGEPVIRQALRHAMRILGRQFVLGRTIGEALDEAGESEAAGYRFSYDMLGEAAMTDADAARYFETYAGAVAAIGKRAGKDGDVISRPGLSVKLSALHPRFEARKSARLADELLPRAKALADMAKAAGLGVTIDAEEMDRLDATLDVFEALAMDADLAGWDGLGLAVQAYGKRALPVLEWLAALADRTGHRLPVRLVKGAYWDTEIKRAQELGLKAYPVFTRKANTDVSYLACAQYLMARRDVFYPQIATHNAHTIAAVMALAGSSGGFEFQRLHGMGRAIYEEVVGPDGLGPPCRIYAPVGGHDELLAYLVRRLLENGANTSFVHRIADDATAVEDIITDPVEKAAARETIAHPRIPLPRDVFQPQRANSTGLALWRGEVREELLAGIDKALARPAEAVPIVGGKARTGTTREITSPHDRRVVVGTVSEADADAMDDALSVAGAAQGAWNARGGAARADTLEKAATLYERDRSTLIALMVREAGKTLESALSDIREAIDFIYYYAAQARQHFAEPTVLPGPTGERNELHLAGRGVFACISPWNFPSAIFTGQVTAALAAGNAVIAKPAEQTPLVAAHCVRLLHEAGVPGDVLHLLPGGGNVGARLVADRRIAGVAFTGSNETAAAIRKSLTERGGALARFIAETGGINAMIVDSTALPEQAVRDILRSAFDSAGQRCSALRVLFVQEDIAPRLLPMLTGAMEELAIGDPLDYATDIGPVIDEDARTALEAHKEKMRRAAKTLCELHLPAGTEHGTYVAPAAYEIAAMSDLTHETFGPILHVVRWRGGELARVCDAINAAGYGLTCAVHSRIDATADEVAARIQAGNIYVNRNQIGAVVGAQPFGGERLSGTGPKAGGPHYLAAFATERVVSTDTTATGGNTALLSIDPDEA